MTRLGGKDFSEDTDKDNTQVGTVDSVVGGTDITVDNTDPRNPVVNSTVAAGDPSPLTTKGDLYTYDTDDQRLAVGTNGQVLTADSAEATGVKWAAAAAGDPLTTKGDIMAFDTDANRLPVGTNDQVLTADSATALGVKWATPAAGGTKVISDETLVSATATMGAALSNLTEVDFELMCPATASSQAIHMYLNSDTTDANYRTQRIQSNDGSISSSEEEAPRAGSLRTTFASMLHGKIRVSDGFAIITVTSSSNTSSSAMVLDVSTIVYEVAITDLDDIRFDPQSTDLPIGSRLVLLNPYV